MTGAEHYQEAERLANSQIVIHGGQRLMREHVDQDVILLAQVHATLALAAATALSESAPDEAEWMKAGASVWKPVRISE